MVDDREVLCIAISEVVAKILKFKRPSKTKEMETHPMMYTFTLSYPTRPTFLGYSISLLKMGKLAKILLYIFILEECTIYFVLDKVHTQLYTCTSNASLH